jgi:hypothetical protein
MNNLALNACLSRPTRLNHANIVYSKVPLKSIFFIKLIKQGFTQKKRIYLNSGLLGAFQHNWLL